jgi:phosphoenolpyruvate phosphomutase
MKSKLFRELMKKELAIGVGAHDGLTAKLIEKNNFDFIWASSLEVSGAYGVPDCSILTMTQFLYHAKMMNDVVNIPILLDADTGYGNAMNVIELVKECERIGVAAICMEDKMYPKQNSLFKGGTQKLMDIPQFCGKIKAAKDTRKDKNFMIFARIEALIAGLGVDEAVKRAKAYSDAGVDGIMIHSKSTTGVDIVEFLKKYRRKTPILLVPTTYKFTKKQIKKFPQVKYMIFANHVIRSEIKAVNEVLRKLKKTGDIKKIDKDVVPLTDLFDLIDMKGFKKNENKYLR